jgi:hypothetical protein
MAGNFCPPDAALWLPAARRSYSLACQAAVDAVRGSFDAAHAAITHRCGPVLSGERFRVLPNAWTRTPGCNCINMSYSD